MDFKSGKRYGNEIRFAYCPICQKENTKNPHFSVNLKTNKYYCHVNMKGGDIKEIKGLQEASASSGPIVEEKEVPENFNELIINKSSNFLGIEWLNYLKSRGISDKHLAKFCREGKFNSMMIPITDGHNVIAVKYRSLDKKCWAEKGSSNKYLLNWQHIKDQSYLIIVEGEIDLLSAIEAGYENTVSLPFGAGNLSCLETQKDWIKGFQKIIIAVDNDEPGKKAQEKIIEFFKVYEKKLFTVELGDYKDFNEVLMGEGKEKLAEIINSAKRIGSVYIPFYEEDDGYYVWQRESYTKVTDFTVKVTGYSDTYIVGIVKTNGREKEFKATKTELLNKTGILEHLGYYLGSAQSIPKFWSFLLEKSKEEYLLEIPYYGIIDNKYYDENSRIICTKQDLKIQQLQNLEPLTQEQKEWLDKNLIYLRSDVNQSLLGLCWALGRFHIHESYPILEVSGTTSIGKTEYVEFISRILFGNKENIKSFTTLTNHQIRSLSSCSNVTPWVIDEVKISGKNLKEKAIELYSTLRAVYDNKTINQGNTTNKLTEFKLCTPLIISGETELSDVSIKNRMISTSLNKKNKSSEDIFFTLKNTNFLEKFGKLALQNRLINGTLDVPLQEVKQTLKDVKDERQLYNGKCMLIGLKALTQILNIDEKIIKDFTEFLNRRLADEYNVITNFLELLQLVVDSGQEMKHFYKIDNKRHLVRFNLLYKAIAEEHSKTNSTLELLDMRTLKKQLLEENFIIETRVSTRFPKDFLNLETVPVKADELKAVDFIDSDHL